MDNQIVSTEENKPLWSLMNTPSVIKKFELACGREAGSVMIEVINAANNNPEIWQCEPNTVITSALNAVTMNLSLAPSLGQACILPFNKSKKVNNVWVTEKQAVLVIMLRGVKSMAMRTGEYHILNPFIVYAGQTWVEDQMTGLGHIEGNKNESNPIIGYGAYLKLLTGYEATVYRTRDEILAHAKRYSPTFDKQTGQFKPKSRWVTDFDEQALKTVMKNLIMNKGKISKKDKDILAQIDTEQADAGTPQWDGGVFNENAEPSEEQPIEGKVTEPELDDNLKIACEIKSSKGVLYVSMPTGELRFHQKGLRGKGASATEQDGIALQAVTSIIDARESGVLQEPGAKQPPLA